MKINRDKKHKNINLDDAIKDVEELEKAQISFWLPKEDRKKFKRKAEDQGTTMKDVLANYINSYISN